MSQAEQYPYGLNQAIHAVAVGAWSHGLDYEEYLRFAGAHDCAVGNTITTALTAIAYKAVCDEWDAKMEKDIADANILTNKHIQRITYINTNDSILLHHWDTAIVPEPQHLFNQRNHVE